LDAALLVLKGIFYLKNHFMALGNPEEGLIIFPDTNNNRLLLNLSSF